MNWGVNLGTDSFITDSSNLATSASKWEYAPCYTSLGPPKPQNFDLTARSVARDGCRWQGGDVNGRAPRDCTLPWVPIAALHLLESAPQESFTSRS